MADASRGRPASSRSSVAALNQDAARIGAELVQLDGGTDAFAAAVRATSMPTVITDPCQPDNPLVFVNDAFCRLTGYAREEILGRNCRFLQGPETDPAAVACIRAAMKAATPIEIDIRNHRKGGEPFWNRLLLAPVRDAAGALAYYLASQVDVTLERERLASLENRNDALLAELADRLRAQQESEARLRFATHAGRLGIWELDLRTGELTASAVCKENFGHDPAAPFPYGALREAVHPDDRECMAAAIERSIATGADYNNEYRALRPGGMMGWVQVRAQVARDPDGTAVRMAGVSLDVTERKLAEEELQRLNEKLEALVAERTAALTQAVDALHAEALEREQTEEKLRQAQKMEAIGQLTGGIAHDFNNMLQGISGSLEMLQRRVEQGRADEAARYIEAARKGVHRAGALTQRLLAFARRQQLQPRPVDADALVRGMEELLRRTMGPAVKVEMRMGDGTWPVLCDANQLESVLLNLAINARDAMPEGGTLSISTADVMLGSADVTGQEGATPGDYVEISVADTGTGMDEVIRARAFEPFFTTKPIGQGTGLGLSQLYGFVRQTGGVVQLESVPGQGTAVRLYLPRHANTGEQEADGDEAVDQAVAGAIGGTVLVVEDEDAVRAVVAEALREQGCRVLEAGDGPAGLRVLQSRERVDVLVTDVGLPGLNGRQLADAARERRPGLPVLFITGYAGGVVEGRLPAGMEVIAKPFALDALAARVRAMAEGRSVVR